MFVIFFSRYAMKSTLLKLAEIICIIININLLKIMKIREIVLEKETLAFLLFFSYSIYMLTT